MFIAVPLKDRQKTTANAEDQDLMSKWSGP
jgi:hypothetical protein